MDLEPKKNLEFEKNIERNQKIDRISNEIIEKLLSLESDPHLTALNDFMHDRVVFVDYLKSKYPNAINYEILHKLIHSTPSYGPMTVYEDFPGEDSVLKYVENLLKKY